ncbi:hypothetical protein COLO4_30728 [Corchorus olitorius]|uniref:DUF4220 domain-containing protein n=1 Tax=Corchorus olitorius TaxID=93759 RepID=A0A1R3H6Z7_9ROSI|nr:hypothetical protein COLO4_30728 [Corchorus olitorius]
MATAALTTLLKLQISGEIDPLEVFWTHFLLLHLGNSETIAAHFSDEKKLWRRYFLGLIIQFGIACYIFVRFERVTHDALTYIAIPIFIAGVIKCVERIWILRFSGFNQFISSAISGTPPKMSRSQGLGQAEQGPGSKIHGTAQLVKLLP